MTKEAAADGSGTDHADEYIRRGGRYPQPGKYAYKIKEGLLEQGYTVHSVGKELQSLNEIPGDLDIIDLCIHPAKGIQLLRECRKPFRCIVIQPGAESPEIINYLQEQNLPYIEGCLLVGMRLYPRKKQ